MGSVNLSLDAKPFTGEVGRRWARCGEEVSSPTENLKQILASVTVWGWWGRGGNRQGFYKAASALAKDAKSARKM